MSSDSEGRDAQPDSVMPDVVPAAGAATGYTHTLKVEDYDIGKIHIVLFGLFGQFSFSIASTGGYYVVTCPSQVAEVDRPDSPRSGDLLMNCPEGSQTLQKRFQLRLKMAGFPCSITALLDHPGL